MRDEHTAAPWKWFTYPDGRMLLVGRTKAVIRCPDAPMTCDQADADLIAAAPDLLQAAKDSVREWRLHGQQTDSCRALEAAIARAEGVAPTGRGE